MKHLMQAILVSGLAVAGAACQGGTKLTRGAKLVRSMALGPGGGAGADQDPPLPPAFAFGPAASVNTIQVDVFGGNYFYGGKVTTALEAATPDTLCFGRTGNTVPDPGFLFVLWSATDCTNGYMKTSKLVLIDRRVVDSSRTQTASQVVDSYKLELVASFNGQQVAVGKATYQQSLIQFNDNEHPNGYYSLYQESFSLDDLCTGAYASACLLGFQRSQNQTQITLSAPTDGQSGVVSNAGAVPVDQVYYLNGSELDYSVDDGSVARLCAGQALETEVPYDFQVGVWSAGACTKDKLPTDKILVLGKRPLSQQQSSDGTYNTVKSTYELLAPGSTTAVGRIEFTDATQINGSWRYSSSAHLLSLCTKDYADACGLQFTHAGDQLAQLSLSLTGRGVTTDRPSVTLRTGFEITDASLPNALTQAAPLCFSAANQDASGFSAFAFYWNSPDCSVTSYSGLGKVPAEDAYLLPYKLISQTTTPDPSMTVKQSQYELQVVGPNGPVSVGALTVSQSFFTSDGSAYQDDLKVTDLCSGSYATVCHVAFQYDDNGAIKSMAVQLN